MRAASLIGLTIEIYDMVQEDPRPADYLIGKFFRERKFLGSHDRKFIAETMYAMLRHKSRLEQIGSGVQGNGDERISGTLASLVVYFATAKGETLLPDFLDGVSEVAGCSRESAEKYFLEIGQYADQQIYADDAARIASEESFPKWMTRKFVTIFDAANAESLCRAMNEQAPVTLRANTLKTTTEECERSLEQENIFANRGKYSPTALILKKRMNAFSSETFRKGFFEMQDEGSQIVSLACDPHPNWKIMDACAGAGGKTLHLAALMQNRGELFACVQTTFQTEEMRKRLRRAGAQNARIVQNEDLEKQRNRFLDAMNLVLIDAPCSGSGTIRRNPIIKWRLTEDKIVRYAEEQLKILDAYCPFVRVNGKLVYATCSLFKEENEDVAERFLLNHPEFEFAPFTNMKLGEDLSIFSTGYLRLYPHIHNTDGFFAAAFIRKT